MGALETCPTEDAIRVLLEYLVDPLLLDKTAPLRIPSLAQQQSVSKQVHAIVLLYNYYHRKQNPELKFLDFDSFCKLAVILRPDLLAYMKLMQRSDDNELDDFEKVLSVTEKAIMDACDISTSLDASLEVPCIDGWPISKVTILLIDSKVQNCLLLFSAITKGVWSIIEKSLDAFSFSSGSIRESKHINKKKRISRKPLRDESGTDEAVFLQQAFSAIKAATGIDQSDIEVLERNLVYSLSKEKTATYFYVMQSTQPSNEGVTHVSIKDAMDSLQGPLFQKSSTRWMVTPVVEYFHVLPYATTVSNWLSGMVFSNCLQDLRVKSGNINVPSSEKTDGSCHGEVEKHTVASNGSCSVSEGFVNKISTRSIDLEKQDRNCLSVPIIRPQDMDVHEFAVDYTHHEDQINRSFDTVQIDGAKKMMMTPCTEINLCGTKIVQKVEMVDSKILSSATECGGEKAAVDDAALINFQSNSKDLEKIQNTLSLKETTLSKTALRILYNRRDKLSLQLRNIEDEIAQCDRNIETILSGGEDDFGVKIESILEACNDLCLRSGLQERTGQYINDIGFGQFVKKKRLSEAVLNIKNPCQELDGICYENNWVLPTYRLSTLNDGFKANVSLKGIDFECTSGGDLCSSPCEARESAAAKMMSKLRSMASVVQ